MYKEVLRSIEGIGIFPSIALILFLGFFITLIVILVKRGRHYWDDAAHLPLGPDKSLKTIEKGNYESI